MVPVRFVAESLDCKVYWDSYNQLVSIFTDNADAAAYAAELQKQQAARKAEEERLAAQRAAQKAEQERLAAQNKTHRRYRKIHYRLCYPTENGTTIAAPAMAVPILHLHWEGTRKRADPCKKCVGWFFIWMKTTIFSMYKNVEN